MQSIEKRTALITGGSKGIGFGIAEMLLKEKMRVAITGRSETALQEAEKKLGSLGELMCIPGDVRSLSSQQEAVKKVIDQWGQLDVMVANAGVGHFASIESITDEQWRETIDINLTGVFYSAKASIEALKRSGGYMITIASLAGTNFFAGGSAYNASKFGLVGFTQAMMLDLRSHGIKVTTIMPGSVATCFGNHQPNEQDAWKIQPEDIGEMVVSLLKMHPRTLPSKIEVRPSAPK
jgi:hypothetical protein